MILEFKVCPLDGSYSMHFKVRGRSDEYDICIKVIEGQPYYKPSACTCKHGSFYHLSETNQKEHKICWHLIECLKLLEYLSYINSDWKNKHGKE